MIQWIPGVLDEKMYSFACDEHAKLYRDNVPPINAIATQLIQEATVNKMRFIMNQRGLPVDTFWGMPLPTLRGTVIIEPHVEEEDSSPQEDDEAYEEWL